MHIKRMVSLSLCLIIGIFLLFSVTGEKDADALAFNASVKNAVPDIYSVILEGDNIVLYIYSESEKKELKRAEASPLREHDVKMLTSGIMTDNLHDALMLLEDFTS